MTDEEKAIATIDYLNEKAGRQFKHTKANKDIIMARIHEGYTSKEIATVTLHKIKDWNADPKMSKYLRPSTIYNKTKFEAYLNEIEAEKAVNEANPDSSSLINQEYEEKDIDVRKGDILTFFTDGVIEARNSEGNFFGFEKLSDVIKENNKYPADYIGRKIYREVTKFLGASSQNDDITIITIKGVYRDWETVELS